MKYTDTRQMTSLGGIDKEPIYIVDNKEVSKADFSNIPVDRIESFTVLKDQSATFVYGERAKGGVVIIRLFTDEEYLERKNNPEKQTYTSAWNMAEGSLDSYPGPKVFILDDKEVSKEDLVFISANDIKGLHIYKGTDGKVVCEFDTKNYVSTYVTVHGLVKDTDGNSLPKAKITVKEGTIKGTVTDEKGYFVLRVPKDVLLQVSYEGMVTSTLKAASELMVTMKKEERR